MKQWADPQVCNSGRAKGIALLTALSVPAGPWHTCARWPACHNIDRISTDSAWGVRCQQALGHPAQ